MVMHGGADSPELEYQPHLLSMRVLDPAVITRIKIALEYTMSDFKNSKNLLERGLLAPFKTLLPLAPHT